MTPRWAFWMMVGAASVAGFAAGIFATHPGPVPPVVIALALPAPEPAPALEPVAATPLPVFVPTLAWALEGPVPLRAARLDRVRRFWRITGDLRCPTSNPHDCVVVHPALGEMA